MNLWNENRLIDIMGHADPALLEEDFPECDLEKKTALTMTEQKHSRKRTVLVAGVAAGSLALTGVAFLVGRKHEWMRNLQRAAGKNVHAA